MPPERTSRPRQEPVSCQFCRTKKLKCNRDQPCQNCLARGIECERKGRLPANRVQHTSVSVENADILARLQRLEDIVLRSKRAESSIGTEPPQRAQSVASSKVSEREKAHKADAEWLESVGLREQSLVKMSFVPHLVSKLTNCLSSLGSPVVLLSALDPCGKPFQTVPR